ncbi:MAG: HD domain-containing protein [Bacilli bacterium]|jgi:hypothetical protein
MDEDRIKHSFAVARKMKQIAIDLGLNDEETNDCFVIGFIHDIGYEFATNKMEHNKIGGEILKRNNFKYWKEIYYHGETEIEYESLYLDILNQADMQIDKYGNDVGYDKRLEDIKSRYGETSIVYEKCAQLIKNRDLQL